MRFQGKIINWNDDKGFGFVEPNGGGTRSFVHIKSFNKLSRRPLDGDLIIYEQIKEKNGKHKAVNIGLVSDRQIQKTSLKKSSTLGKSILLTFCVFISVAFFLDLIPIKILYAYIALSILTFVIYAFDKSAAKNGRWRTSESQLHLLSLIGGWPGAFFAQSKLRHKSSKKEFQQVYWTTVMINICAFGWLISEKGQPFLAAIGG